MPRLSGTLVRAAEVGAVGGLDLEDVAWFDEEGDLHGDAGFEGGGFGGVVGGVALDAFAGFGDLEFRWRGGRWRRRCLR